MIKGVGVDLITTERIKRAVENSGEAFLDKIYTDREKNYCRQRSKNKFQHYACRFAAKEAVLKSYQLGWDGTDWKNIEVLNRENGAPYVELHEKLGDATGNSKNEEIHLSLSHFGEYAQAFAVRSVSISQEGG